MDRYILTVENHACLFHLGEISHMLWEGSRPDLGDKVSQLADCMSRYGGGVSTCDECDIELYSIVKAVELYRPERALELGLRATADSDARA
jgi:hypothetical protein